jgi:hypothetical protein
MTFKKKSERIMGISSKKSERIMGISSKKSERILAKHLPKLEEDVKDIKDKTMSPLIATDVKSKALAILEKNFKGKQLEKMKLELDKTMKTMGKNYGK